MNLTLDGASVNAKHETFTYDDLITANLNGVKRGREIAEMDARETIEILRHNLKTALMVLDGKGKLEPWQREILDKSAGGNHGNGTGNSFNRGGSVIGCAGCDSKREERV